MDCPNCGTRAKVLWERAGVKHITCDCCLFDGEVEDREEIARLKAVETAKAVASAAAEAAASADANIMNKVRTAVNEAGSALADNIRREIKDALKDLDKASIDAGEKVFEKNHTAVLEIGCDSGSGSGFIINGQAYAITNTHVVCDDQGKVCSGLKARLQGGEWVPLKVIKCFGAPCTLNDIALIRLDRMPRNSTYVRLGNSEVVKNGQQLFAIGNSLGKGTCIVAGIVSDSNRGGFIMHDAPANPGNSGCAVFNKTGEVISVHDAGEFADEVVSVTGQQGDKLVGRRIGIKAAGMKYSIPINHVKKLIAEYNV